MFSQKIIHVSDAQLCREILAKRPKIFKRGTVYESMANKLNYRPSGMFHSDDPLIWRRMKKVIAPTFSTPNLTATSLVLLEETTAFMERIRQLIRMDVDIDFIFEATMYATKVVSKVIFGSDTNEYFTSLRVFCDLKTTMTALVGATFSPFPEWIWRMTQGYTLELSAREADERFTAACQELIGRKSLQHSSLGKEEINGLNSLTDIMLRHSDVQEAEILANVKTFYLAGSDTTSVTLSWAVFLLHLHPHVAERLRTEAALFFVHDWASRSSQEVNDAISCLKYAAAVFQETVRLYPVGPLLFLDVVDHTQAVQLSNGMIIEPSCTVMLQLLACMKDESYFQDADKFDPSRWLTEDKEQLSKMELAFMGFGAGSRACPGKCLALRQGALTLAALFHNFELCLACPVEEITAEYWFTMQPNKMPIRATIRN
eukprot:gene13307-15329_t